MPLKGLNETNVKQFTRKRRPHKQDRCGQGFEGRPF